MHATAFRLPLAILAFVGVALFFSNSAQAASQTATVGQAVTFSVTADGTSPFSYQWYKNSVAISGARSASYTLSACATCDSGSYYVVVSNLAGSTTSDNAVLTVNPAIVGVRVDFNRDGQTDILWRNAISGQIVVWFMNGSNLGSCASLGAVSTDWQIAGVGDFNADGQTDILWRNTNSGQIVAWFMNGSNLVSCASLGAVPIDWQIAGVGDFNGDGQTDILWRNANSGQIVVWFMNGSNLVSCVSLGAVSTDWQIVN